MPCSFLV